MSHVQWNCYKIIYTLVYLVYIFLSLSLSVKSSQLVEVISWPVV